MALLTRSDPSGLAVPAAAAVAAASGIPAGSAAPPPAPLAFGDFVLDPANASLHRRGQPVALAPKALAVLVHLAQQPGRLVDKGALLDAVWGHRHVSDGAVKSLLSGLRAALDDDAKAPRWIETVPRRGYRFASVVEAIGAVGAAAAADAAPVASAASAATAANAGVAARAVTAAPAANSRLPPRSDDTIGRSAELAALRTLVGAHRLVSLTGTAGVGKTRLALDLAATLQPLPADGVWWLALAPLPADTTDNAALRQLLAATLALAPGAVASDERLVVAMQPLALLLVLDNAEHLLDALAPLLAHLLQRLPRVHWLVTSREPLRLGGEQVLRLLPLAVPSAGGEAHLGSPVATSSARLAANASVQLFTRRVAQRVPGWRPGDDQLGIAGALCRALDGLPLAIELAAARVPTLGLSGLALALLTDGDTPGARLQLLAPAGATGAPHQRSLRSTLAWSHDLLTPVQQLALRRLSVFRGSFTPALALALLGADGAGLDEWEVIDALQSLVDKSLLHSSAAVAAPGATAVATTATVPMGPPAAIAASPAPAARLSMLQSVHHFAAEQLLAHGELQATQRRHLAVMRAYWAAADRQALLQPAMAWMQQHADTVDDLRAALRWAVTQPAPASGAGADDPLAEVQADLLALVGATALLWPRIGQLGEGLAWCQSVSEAAERIELPQVRATANGAPAGAASDAAAASDAHDAPDATERLALAAGIDLARANLMRFDSRQPAAEGLRLATRAAARYRRLGDALREAYALYLVYALRQELNPGQDCSDAFARMQTLLTTGPAAEPQLGPFAGRFLRSALLQTQRLQGRHAEFLAGSRAELALALRHGAEGEAWSSAHVLMQAEDDGGNPAASLAVGAAALQSIRQAGRLRQYAQFLCLHTCLLAAHGPPDQTRRALTEALPLLPTMGACEILYLALAWLAWREQRPQPAALLLGWFLLPGHARNQDGPASCTGRLRLRLLEQLERVMDRERLADLLRQGHKLGGDAAVALALAG